MPPAEALLLPLLEDVARHGLRQPGMLGGLGLDDFYRYQAPLFRQRP